MDDPNIWQSIGTGIASIIAGVAGWFAYQIKKENRDCLSETQVRALIEDKLKDLITSQKYINDRLDRIESKLDRVMEYLLDDSTGKRGRATPQSRTPAKRI